MKRTLLFICTFFCFHSFSQSIFYAAYKPGLSLRDKAGTNGKVIEKIPYGQKLVTVYDTTAFVQINTDGFFGNWVKVKYNNKEGYVVNSYLLPIAPPKPGTKTLMDYFSSFGAAGTPVTVKKGNMNNIEGNAWLLKKQLYKNGTEWHHMEGWEYNAESYFLPDFSIEQAYLVMRLIPQYPELIADKDALPLDKASVKKDYAEKTIEVERENWDGKPGPAKRIKITYSEGAYTEFEIIQINGHAVIQYSSGV